MLIKWLKWLLNWAMVDDVDVREAVDYSKLKSANTWLRSDKAISNVAGALAKSNVPYAAKVADVASKLGYGGRRRRRRRRDIGGANFFSTSQIARPIF